MDHLDKFLGGCCVGALIVLVILKAMHTLDISLWLLIMPLATPAVCIVLITIIENKFKGGSKNG